MKHTIALAALHVSDIEATVDTLATQDTGMATSDAGIRTPPVSIMNVRVA